MHEPLASSGPSGPISFITPQPSSTDASGSVVYRDRPFGIAFLVHVGAIAYVAFAYGAKAVSADALSTSTSNTNTATAALDLNADLFLRAISVAIVVGAASALLLLEVLRRLAGSLIRVAILGSAALQIGSGVALIALGLFPGVVLIAFGAFTLLYYWCVRSRIAFAAAHVEIGVTALRAAPGLICVAVLLLVAQAGWSILWTLAALGVESIVNPSVTSGSTSSSSSNNSGMSGTIAVFALLMSYFWGSVLLRNIAAFCAASVVGDWWWKGAAETHQTSGAIKRALTTSFGTLSFGALLVSFARALKAMSKMRSSEKEGKAALAVAIVACIAQCIIAIFAAVIEWANQCAPPPPLFSTPRCSH